MTLVLFVASYFCLYRFIKDGEVRVVRAKQAGDTKTVEREALITMIGAVAWMITGGVVLLTQP